VTLTPQERVERRAAIGAHRETLDLWLDASERALRCGDRTAAAVYAEVAADFAWTHHAGLFTSHRLESVMCSLGAGLSTPVGPGSRSPSPERVLHVMTQAYGSGGHTRLARLWMSLDYGRRHSLALTDQGRIPVPGDLAAAVHSCGGAFHRVDRAGRDPLARAAALRQATRDTDVVVLHIHPYDVVPAIALAARTAGPPVVLMNHSDCTFWLGTAIAEIVAHFRPGAVNTSCERRGVARERAVVLPLPLEPPPKAPNREEARRRLGVDPSAIVLLSVGAARKFHSPVGEDLLEALRPALLEDSRLHLVVVGPQPDSRWRDWSRRTGGRIRAVGVQPDLTRFYRAADVFVDSYPIGSSTAMLEAGLAGLPVVRLRHFRSGALMHADEAALEGHVRLADDPSALRRLISGLGDSREASRNAGWATREAVAAVHLGEGWRPALKALYAHATSAQPPAGPSPKDPESGRGEVDVEVAWLQWSRGAPQDFGRRLGRHLRPLGAADRARAWVRAVRRGNDVGRRALGAGLARGFAPGSWDGAHTALAARAHRRPRG
jgi:glycosyltransferase involved in cell wall biosynthesis